MGIPPLRRLTPYRGGKNSRITDRHRNMAAKAVAKRQLMSSKSRYTRNESRRAPRQYRRSYDQRYEDQFSRKLRPGETRLIPLAAQ